MDLAAARVAAHAWHLQHKAVRRVVVARGKDGLAVDDPVPLFTLTSAGLYVARLDRTFSWSQVLAAEVPPADRSGQLQLAIQFRLADPDPALIFPAHWLDQDPGVILVTAQQYIAIARAANPPPTQAPIPG